MPFPVLSRTDFTPTSNFLSVEDYFNPTKNTEYYTRRPERIINNTIKGSDYLTILKNLTTPESMKDIYKVTHKFFGQHVNTSTKAVFDAFCSLLPDDAKWLAWFVFSSAYRDLGGGVISYRLRLRFPQETVYNEISWDQFEVHVGTRLVDVTNLTYAPDAVQLEALRQKLVSDRIVTKVLEKFSSVLSDTAIITTGDPGSNPIPLLTYRYASGSSLFYPVAFDSSIGFQPDWASPSFILETMNNPEYRVSLTFPSNYRQVQYTVKPKAGNRRSIERVLAYSSNVFDYLPFVIKGPKEPKATLYGVELEACGDYQPKELIDAQKDLFFILKQDSSIHGSKPNKYELVTIPASLKAHKRLWAEFFEKVDYNHFDTSKDTGNGMHVHIGRNCFTQSHLNRFTWFIINPAHNDFILSMSERPSKRNLDDWARMPSVIGERTRLRAARSAARKNEGNRGAVHYKGNSTVEVRIFKGIVSYATIVKNLEFVDSVFEYTRVTPLSQINLKSYISWINETPKNKYLSLKTFFAQVKLKDFVTSAEVNDYLWNKTHDQDVTALLNKAPFKVTNSHITVLNQKRKKRTFILKNGEVVCLSKNGGLLANLDKSLQQKQTRGAASFSLTEFAA